MINLRIQPDAPTKAPEITTTPRISVIGVGGAGGNAVRNMIESNLQGVEFVVCNTDAQALENSPCAKRIQLGTTVTSGLGAGSRPDVGRVAAQENIDEVLAEIEGANMVFITAGMGGGTGTGAAPVIAKACRDRGILTVGVVTKPFHFEGAHRMRSAEEGLKDMEDVVDTLIVIPNQNLFRIANEKTTFAEAFRLADGVLQSGVRGVTDLMVMPGLINLDFNDIRNVMEEMGKAMMGTGEAEGEGRAIKAAEAAVNNPLLDDVSMKGAKGVIINITGGYDMTLFEVDEACNHIRDEVDPDANIIFGSTFDERMKGTMRVSVVATGIDQPMAARQRPSTTAPVTQARAAAPEVADQRAPFSQAPVTAYQEPTPVGAHPAYSPTIKTPSSTFNYTIPSAPPVQAAPELPLMNAARANEHFIPPAPYMPDTAPMPPQQHVASDMPAFAATPRTAPSAGVTRMPNMDGFESRPGAQPQSQRRAPSIFDRIKGRITGSEGGHHAPQTTQHVPQAVPARRHPSSAAAQATLDIDTRPLAAPQASAAEDDLEIPAFLRRQAN